MACLRSSHHKCSVVLYAMPARDVSECAKLQRGIRFGCVRMGPQASGTGALANSQRTPDHISKEVDVGKWFGWGGKWRGGVCVSRVLLRDQSALFLAVLGVMRADSLKSGLLWFTSRC